MADKKKTVRWSWKRFGIRLGLMAVSTLLALGMAEMALRWNIVPNARYRRLHAFGAMKKANLKMVILGDSYIESEASLDVRLNPLREQRGVTIFNLATQGLGPADYHTQMASAARYLAPQVVLLSYYVGNDLTDTQYKPSLMSAGFPKTLRAPSAWSLDRLYLYDAYKFAAQQVRTRWTMWQTVPDGSNQTVVAKADAMGLWNPCLLATAEQHPNYLLDNILMETAENRQAWEVNRLCLKAIAAMCREIHAQLVVVIFPREIQIDKDRFDLFRRIGCRLDDRTLTCDKPQQLMKALCAEEKIACLDMLPVLRTRRSDDIFRENDDHLNDEGNTLAARAIIEFLEKETVIGKGMGKGSAVEPGALPAGVFLE